MLAVNQGPKVWPQVMASKDEWRNNRGVGGGEDGRDNRLLRGENRLQTARLRQAAPG